MADMIERFLKLFKCVRLALIEAGSKITFTDAEHDALVKLLEVLRPAKYAVERLSRRDATLLTAERINKVVFSSLKKVAERDENPNELAETFLNHLTVELAKRRPTDLIHLMEYLRDPSYIKSTKADLFGHAPGKTKVVDLATTLLSRLFAIEDVQVNTSP